MDILSLVFQFFLGVYAQAGLAVINVPAHFDDSTVIHDVAYGADEDQTLDIYLPVDKDKSHHDVLVFYYGGRWTTGSKEDYKFVGAAFAARGYIVVIPDYRKYPKVKFPVFVQDGAKALAWTFDHIEGYGGSRNRIAIAGHSAGAHIASLLAANPTYLAAEGKNRADVIQSFAGLAGPYAFTPDEADLEDMFGPPQNYPLMQTPTFIDGKQPPMLLMYGTADTTVKPLNDKKLADAIYDKGGVVKTIAYPDIDHIDILVAISWLGSSKAPVVDDMISFFNTVSPEKQ